MTTSTTGLSDPSREAARAVMHSFSGRAAVERCIRAAGGEPPEDRLERARAHLEAHGATVTEQGGVLWPVPQDPSLTTILGSRQRREQQARDIVNGRETAARAAEKYRG